MTTLCDNLARTLQKFYEVVRAVNGATLHEQAAHNIVRLLRQGFVRMCLNKSCSASLYAVEADSAAEVPCMLACCTSPAGKFVCFCFVVLH